MNFKNKKHSQVFDEAVRKRNKKNFALMAAIYLLLHLIADLLMGALDPRAKLEGMR